MCSIWIGAAKELTLRALADEQVRLEHKIKELDDDSLSHDNPYHPEARDAIAMNNGEINGYKNMLKKLKVKTDELMAKFREIEKLDDELDEAARVRDESAERMLHGEIDGRMKELGHTRR